MTNSTAQRSYV